MNRENQVFGPSLVVVLLGGILCLGDSLHTAGQTATQATKPVASAESQASTQALEPGKPIERELAGGQAHSYQITLQKDQYLYVVVEQKGVDVVVTLFGPNGKALIDVDSPNGTQGPEPVSFITEVGGTYRLQVKSLEKDAPVGLYEVDLKELRIATNKDRELSEARRLNHEALVLYQSGKYNEALPLVISMVALLEKAMGKNDHAVANALTFLAILHSEKGDYREAESLYQRALTIDESVLGPNDPEVGTDLSNLALNYHDQGEYDKAEQLYKRALTIQEKALGANHTGVGITLNNLALVYYARGEYDKAEPLYQRVLTIRENAWGPDHPDVSNSLDTLGELYVDEGELDKAEALLLRALSIRERKLGPDHPWVAISLNNLASLYRSRGEYARAESMFLRAMTIHQKTGGSNHPSVAVVLSNLAMVYAGETHYDKAEEFERRALRIREAVLSRNDPAIATSLNHLAGFYVARGDYGNAEPLYQRSLEIFETVFGASYPKVAASYERLAALYRANGDIAKAIIYQSRGNDSRERDLARNLAAGSERHKLLYLNLSAEQTARTLSLHIQSAPNDLAACRVAFTILLRRKGRALDAMNDSLKQVRRNLKPQDQTLLSQLIESRALLATRTINGPGKLKVEEHRAILKQLDERIDQLEGELSARSAEFRTQSQSITIEAVQKAIPAGAVLVEFASYRSFDAKAEKYGTERFVAYTLAGQGEPQWVDLGEAAPIEHAVESLRTALRDPKRKDVKQLARALDARTMQPVRKLIGRNKWLMISPDGALNLIPFAALVDENDHYLVEEYLFTFLTSGRDLLRLQVPIAARQGVLVMANPDFGERAAGREDPKLKPIQTNQAQMETTPANLFSKFYFPPLPGTALEGEALRDILSNVTLLTQRQATKRAVVQADGPKILHIATHGFFLQSLGTQQAGMRGLQLLTDDPPRLMLQQGAAGITGGLVENPLLRSGLALAGANEHKSDDNGILTAVEVAGLSLWGTKLVVLSACDTGVGEVRNGDGVYGLRRALVLAGSESQVMSLWPVNDAATRDLMIEYYRAIQAGQGRGEALRHVQLKMLNDPKHNHPAYWASFIQSGAWSPLQ